MIFMAHAATYAHFGDFQFLSGPLYCLNFLHPFRMMRAGGKAWHPQIHPATARKSPLQSPLTPDGENIVILS